MHSSIPGRVEFRRMLYPVYELTSANSVADGVGVFAGADLRRLIFFFTAIFIFLRMPLDCDSGVS